MMSYRSKAAVRLGVLDARQADRIHQASLEILSRTGVVVQSREALSLLAGAGAAIDDVRVRIPGRLVAKALETAPKSITIHDRQGRVAMSLEDGRTYFGTGSDCPSVIDLETGQHRASTKADVARNARVCDGLVNIDFCMSMGIASDASQITSYVHQFDAMVRHTSKPLVFTAQGADDMRDILDLAMAVVAGGREELKVRPRHILYNEPISPLNHTPDGLAKMMFAAEHGIPMIYIGSPMMGASAPVTMAGCIAQANAEGLSGLVIHQLKCPGAPFIYGADASILDMRTMIFVYGAPELQLMDMAFADLARRYQLPFFCIAGASDAKVLDAQAGAEMAQSLLVSALNGCNLIHDVGYLESGLCSSAESVVLADELIGMVRRYLAAFEISEDTLALDVIDRVGPTGDFLSDDHTLANYRRDVWYPAVFDRRRFEAWFADGGEPINKPLQRKAQTILADCEGPALSAQQTKTMDEILARRG